MLDGRVDGVKLWRRVIREERVERVIVYNVMFPCGERGDTKETWMMEEERAMRTGGKTPSGAVKKKKN